MSKVLVLLAAPLQPGDTVRITVHKSGDTLTVSSRTRNPYTLQFCVPGECSFSSE